jgi:hypothetical protein
MLFTSLQLEKVLTRLDGIALPEGDTELRVTRKDIVKSVQVQLERADVIDSILKTATAEGSGGSGGSGESSEP